MPDAPSSVKIGSPVAAHAFISTRHVADADRCELIGGVVRSIARPPHCDHDPLARDGLRPQLTEGYVHSVGDVSESPLHGLPDVEQQRAATGQVTRRARVDLGGRVSAVIVRVLSGRGTRVASGRSLNDWTSLLVFRVAVGLLVLRGRHRRSGATADYDSRSTQADS